ncbi:unnamed protein product [Parajaminaea phylloscopi]
MDAELGHQSSGLGIPKMWTELSDLLNRRTTALNIPNCPTAVRAAVDYDVVQHMTKAGVLDLFDSDQEWLRLAVLSRCRAEALFREAVAGKQEIERAARFMGYPVGTRAAEQQNKRARERAQKIRRLVQDYNDLCGNLAYRRPGDPRNPPQISGPAGSASAVIEALFDWTQAPFGPISSLPNAQLSPWRTDRCLRRALDGYELSLRLREEMSILQSDLAGMAAFQQYENDRISTLLASSPCGPLQWFVQKHRRWNIAMHTQWSVDLQRSRRTRLARCHTREDFDIARSAVQTAWRAATQEVAAATPPVAPPYLLLAEADDTTQDKTSDSDSSDDDDLSLEGERSESELD